MYISIKLPPEFGSFNKLQAENYPFNALFTEYLAAISRLGMEKGMDVGELVGWIEDTVFEGRRLPDVPEGGEAVNIRYRTDDKDVAAYIGGSGSTNRMAVMWIARMTLRLSEEYGTSLFRLTRVIKDLSGTPEKSPVRKEPKRRAERSVQDTPEEKGPVLPRVSSKGQKQEEQEESEAQPLQQQEEGRTASAMDSARAARAAMEALGELDRLTGQAEEEGGVVATNPALAQFL